MQLINYGALLYTLSGLTLKSRTQLFEHYAANSTSIDFYDNSASLETAMRAAKDFRLKKEEALSIIKEVALAVKQWRSVASDFGLSKRECDRVDSTFVWEEK